MDDWELTDALEAMGYNLATFEAFLRRMTLRRRWAHRTFKPQAWGVPRFGRVPSRPARKFRRGNKQDTFERELSSLINEAWYRDYNKYADHIADYIVAHVLLDLPDPDLTRYVVPVLDDVELRDRLRFWGRSLGFPTSKRMEQRLLRYCSISDGGFKHHEWLVERVLANIVDDPAPGPQWDKISETFNYNKAAMMAEYQGVFSDD